MAEASVFCAWSASCSADRRSDSSVATIRHIGCGSDFNLMARQTLSVAPSEFSIDPEKWCLRCGSLRATSTNALILLRVAAQKTTLASNSERPNSVHASAVPIGALIKFTQSVWGSIVRTRNGERSSKSHARSLPTFCCICPSVNLVVSRGMIQVITGKIVVALGQDQSGSERKPHEFSGIFDASARQASSACDIP